MRIAVGGALLILGGAFVSYMVANGKTPTVAISTAQVAAKNTARPTVQLPEKQAVSPTAAKMVELQPIGEAAPKATAVTSAPTVTAAPAKTPTKPAPTVASAQTATAGGSAFKKIQLPGRGDFPVYVGPNYKADDGKPVYVCTVLAFNSYLTAVQLQMQGLDVANGFHLALVPYDIDGDDYAALSTDALVTQVRTGAWDCDIGTADVAARTGYGAITAIVDESVGGDGIYARNIESIYELKGKRLAFVAGDSTNYFLNYTLFVANIEKRDVTLLPFETLDAAVDTFKKGEADAVSAYDPHLAPLTEFGGRPLILSDQLRVVIDVIVTSPVSIKTKKELVQSFHNAWFEAMKRQAEDYDGAAKSIASWGNNDWSGVSVENAAADYRAAFSTIASADLLANAEVMKSPDALLVALNAARSVSAASGQVTSVTLKSLIDPQFVLAADTAARRTEKRPLNNTFSLAGERAGADLSAMQTVLPCRQYTFQPNTAELDESSKRVLDLCVVPALQQRPDTTLEIIGSAAWPGPKGKYAESQIIGFGLERARAVAGYLRQKGIGADRLQVKSTLPPPDRRELVNETAQVKDRFVQMTIASAR